MKIALVGYSGAGKSTLARELGSLWGIPVLHLDRVQFESGWKERDRDEARAMVRGFMQNDSWVIDGNYRSFYQAERFEQADTILFLNLPRLTCFLRAFGRYLKNRGQTRIDMAEGCPEKFDLEFARWILFDGRTAGIRSHYRQVMAEYPQKAVVFKNTRQIDRFLEGIVQKAEQTPPRHTIQEAQNG